MNAPGVVTALPALGARELVLALHALRSASAQHAKLDAQLQHMQALASEAQQLQAQPRTSPQDAARALQRVQRDLQKRGLGLKVWDAYRPLSVQQKMWNLIRDERYVSNPAKNKGRHTRGTAVDVTLIDKLGRELPMPSNFDDFSERAHREYRGGTAAQRRNRQSTACGRLAGG